MGERNNRGGERTITKMRNVAYGAMHRGSEPKSNLPSVDAIGNFTEDKRDP